jgi:hypothetical protein
MRDAASGRRRRARFRRSLWQPPRLHAQQPRERLVGPLELFYGLAVVVLVAQDARHLALHLTWRGLGQFAVVVTLVWIAWLNGRLHHELHGREDARARSTFLLQILTAAVAAMGAATAVDRCDIRSPASAPPTILTVIRVDPDPCRHADQGRAGANPDRPASRAAALLRHEHKYCGPSVRHCY